MIKDLLRFLRLPAIAREPWTPDDQAAMDTFVTSSLCLSVEKDLRNRIADLTDEALKYVGEVKGVVAVGKLAELQDIMLGWKNLRSDLQKK